MSLSATFRAGVAAFSKSASLTLAQTGVTINTICPGGVATDRLVNLISAQAELSEKSEATLLAEAQSSIPIGRFAEPREIADFAVFLCSDNASYITGRVHSIDGGLVSSF